MIFEITVIYSFYTPCKRFLQVQSAAMSLRLQGAKYEVDQYSGTRALTLKAISAMHFGT